MMYIQLQRRSPPGKWSTRQYASSAYITRLEVQKQKEHLLTDLAVLNSICIVVFMTLFDSIGHPCLVTQNTQFKANDSFEIEG